MKDLGYEFPKYSLPVGQTEDGFLRERTCDGARGRYGSAFPNALPQLEREPAVIGKLNLAGYFLIVWDIVNYCRTEGILVQGRGSAANSAVCYSLGITAVDPIAGEFLFERFLTETRGEWPDMDLDLPSGDRPERVIQHVYQLYGERGAAMMAMIVEERLPCRLQRHRRQYRQASDGASARGIGQLGHYACGRLTLRAAGQGGARRRLRDCAPTAWNCEGYCVFEFGRRDGNRECGGDVRHA